jgi:hypothetical protein
VTIISKRYLCKDCGFKWSDTKVNLNRPNPFLRCLRCESKNIGIPKSDTLRYRALFLIFQGIHGSTEFSGSLSDLFSRRFIPSTRFLSPEVTPHIKIMILVLFQSKIIKIFFDLKHKPLRYEF